MNLSKITASDLLNVRKELFKRGEFNFIACKDGKLHERQLQALQILADKKTKEIAYGGAAGGAKSWTGASWESFMCLCYPGTTWFVGRESLKDLRDSTLITFHKVFKSYGFAPGLDYRYNGQDHFIDFPRLGSRIYFLELAALPSDPLFERLGSKEFTGGWIEEAGEISFEAYDALKSRVGRQLNDKYGIAPKILTTLNPKKNWIHGYFWKRHKDNTLPESVIFIPSLVTDNPHIESNYIEQLDSLKGKIQIERLRYGNFDYDDDSNMLMTYDSINDTFYAEHRIKRTGEKFITADVARFGKDSVIIKVWDGFLVIERHELFKKSITETAAFIKDLAGKHNIPMSKVIADEDGVGGGVVDILKCKGFVNGSTPLENPLSHAKENYADLKTQCSYMAAEMVNAGQIGYADRIVNHAFKQKFSEEAEQVKRKDPDSDGKLKLVPKEEIKKLIGRSPDDWDAFMMRMYFKLKPPKILQYG